MPSWNVPGPPAVLGHLHAVLQEGCSVQQPTDELQLNLHHTVYYIHLTMPWSQLCTTEILATDLLSAIKKCLQAIGYTPLTYKRFRPDQGNNGLATSPMTTDQSNNRPSNFTHVKRPGQQWIWQQQPCQHYGNNGFVTLSTTTMDLAILPMTTDQGNKEPGNITHDN